MKNHNKEIEKYTLGFLFDKNKENILLIQKNRPEWQKGKFNAIGGKVEEDEDVLACMEREFEEETSLKIEDWQFNRDLNLVFPHAYVHVYYQFSDEVFNFKSETDEQLSLHEVSNLPEEILPDVKHLIKNILVLDYFKNTKLL